MDVESLTSNEIPKIPTPRKNSGVVTVVVTIRDPNIPNIADDPNFISFTFDWTTIEPHATYLRRMEELAVFLQEIGVESEDYEDLGSKLNELIVESIHSDQVSPHFGLVVVMCFHINEFDINEKSASKSVVDSLPRRVPNTIEEERCSICLEDFNNGEMILKLTCGHEFDEKCIVEWFKINHVCPLCRYELPCKEEEKDEREIRMRRIEFDECVYCFW